jgi:hypothetical protein
VRLPELNMFFAPESPFMTLCCNIDTLWFPLTRKLEPTQPWRQPSVSAIDPSIHFSLRVKGSTFVRAIMSQDGHW